MKIVFFGTPSFVVPVLKTLAKDFTIVGVVTAPDTVQGRKKLLTPSPIKQFAHDILKDISILTIEQFDDAVVKELQGLSPDLFVVAAYGKIIPQRVLDIPRAGAINIHPSLLPAYRGPSPIQTALLHGDTQSGITIIKMDEQVDHGPIIKQWEFPLSPTDTFAKLHVTMFEDAAERIGDVINDFTEGKLVPQIQDDTQATFCEKVERSDGYIDLHNPPAPEVIDRMIRAYYPWPNVWCKVQMANGQTHSIKLYPENKIQMEGKTIVGMKEFLNGYPELKQQLEQLLQQK